MNIFKDFRVLALLIFSVTLNVYADSCITQYLYPAENGLGKFVIPCIEDIGNRKLYRGELNQVNNVEHLLSEHFLFDRNLTSVEELPPGERAYYDSTTGFLFIPIVEVNLGNQTKYYEVLMQPLSPNDMSVLGVSDVLELPIERIETDPIAPPIVAPAPLPIIKPIVGKVKVVPEKPEKFEYDEAELDIGIGAVDDVGGVDLEIKSLFSIPPLDPGMVNVTKGPRKGYRFLPSMNFKKKIKVKLPYSKSLLPLWAKENEIKTYYYDEEEGKWIVLERVDVDTNKQEIVSHTDHFTDMINAVVTAPDAPQNKSFSNTELKDIKAANPAAGINMIKPPQASQMGGASLSYPLELPAGRAGVQPQLVVQHQSGGGNSWIGHGWSLSIPSIGIDTRWGVPRYDMTFETETYTFSGQQLDSLTHRGELKPRQAEKTFRTRVEGGFQRIIRHGDSPKNYWWEVTQKNGSVSYYGGSPETGLISESVIIDYNGNVFQWFLWETLDTHDNNVKYRYVKVDDVGLVNGTVPGYDVYPKSIHYTGHNLGTGPYTITFIRDRELSEDKRKDISIDARGAFKRVTADLLRKVEITYGDETVRSYEFKYAEGAFHKTLLQSIAQYGADGSFFNEHTFEYFDDARNDSGLYKGFEASKHLATGNDDVSTSLFGQGDASALGGTVSEALNGHLYLGLGPGGKICTKDPSGGFKVGYQRSKSEGLASLIDINGDGLADKVYKKGNTVYYRANQSKPRQPVTFGQAQVVANLPDLSRDKSTMKNKGAEGYFKGANIGINIADTTTESHVYIADVNSDGLPDLVNHGQVLFNHINEQGQPFFSPDSSDTPYPIGQGVINGEAVLADLTELFEEQIDAFPLLDSVRRWSAPFDGTISISGDVALQQDNSETRQQYQSADGVRVAIQLNENELWSARIEADDYTAKTPGGVEALTVQQGDIVYFRVQSVFDGAYDQVSWQPDIQYLDVDPVLDANQLDVYHYNAGADFSLATYPGNAINMPMAGTIELRGKFQKAAITSDDVTLELYRNGQAFFSQTLAWNEIGTIDIQETLTVAEQEGLSAQVKIDSPIDIKQLQWTQALQAIYTDAGDITLTDEAGNPTLQFDLLPYYDLYPKTDLTEPLQAWEAPTTGTYQLSSLFALMPGDIETTGGLIITAKKAGEVALAAKVEIPIEAGNLTNDTVSFAAVQGERFYFEISTRTPGLIEKLSQKAIGLQGAGTSVEPPTAIYESHFLGVPPREYRGWTVLAYNGNRERAEQPLNITAGDLDGSAFQAAAENGQAQAGASEDMTDIEEVPDNAPNTGQDVKVYPVYPDWQQGIWLDASRDENFAISPEFSASSRMGPDDISIPRPEQMAGATAVPRISKSKNKGIAGGFSYGFVSASAGFGRTKSQGILDFMDMNGDRFPDVVGSGNIQFSAMVGGLSNQTLAVLDGDVRGTEADSYNLGAGGTFPLAETKANGETDNSTNTMANLGGGYTSGKSESQYDLMDVNGDGLPDRVSQSGSQLMVALNMGTHGFTAYEPWGDVSINKNHNKGGSLSAGAGFSSANSYNKDSYGYGGGVNLSKNESKTDHAVTDINGDGLLDRIKPVTGGFQIGLNTGNGFMPDIFWPGSNQGINTNQSNTMGAGGYFTIGIPIPPPPIGPLVCIIINPGADGTKTMNRPETSISDLNGDGYPDYLQSDSDSSINASFNQIGKTNLLKTVHLPLGSSYEIDYQRVGNTYKQPSSQWVMSELKVHDGHAGDGVDTQVKTFEYEDGFYHRREREFFGFAKVTENQLDSDGSVYRSVVSTYHNDSYYNKGLQYNSVTLDAQGNKYLETENTYVLRDVDSGNELGNLQHLTAVVFPELVRTDKHFYEGQAAPGKSTFETFAYNAIGDIVHLFQAGDEGAMDDVEADIGYFIDNTAHIIAPNSITVKGNGALMRKRESTIQSGTGDVTEIRQYLADGSAAVTNVTYDQYGNIDILTGPANYKGERYGLSYTYDPEVHTYNTEVKDSFGYVSSAGYDLRFGTTLFNKDINGQVISYEFDEFGRNTVVIGPYQQGEEDYTIRFEYHHDADIPWALTQHIDVYRDVNDSIETVTFMDGLGRAIQTKKDATIHQGESVPAQDKMIVSGAQIFDAFGRTVKAYYPVMEAKGTESVFNFVIDNIQPTETEYDVLDRALSITAPDDTVTSTEYGFGTDRDGRTQFFTRVIDANGIAKESYRNVREAITAIKEFNNNGVDIIWTSYQYDALKQITAVIDNKDNITHVEYDNLGRRTVIDSPDAGKTAMVYDLASNLREKITANLREEGKAIVYDYDYTRLSAINYPNFTENNVIYTYGAPNAQYNRANRVVTVTDESGMAEYFYGPLGETVKTIRTIASKTQGNSANSAEVYVTEQLYDTWNRLQKLLYPDGEVLTNRYDSGGLLYQIYGEKGSNDANNGRSTRKSNPNSNANAGNHANSNSSDEFNGKAMGTVNGKGQAVGINKDKGKAVGIIEKGNGNAFGIVDLPDNDSSSATITSDAPANSVISTIDSAYRYNYLDNLEYDKFEQRVLVQYGNGTKSTYSYDERNRRLANLKADSSLIGQFQDLAYDYDNVGNILGLANRAEDKSESQMGGATSFNYVYDDLYRLVHADGIFDFDPDKQHHYTLDMEYDSIHNILRKNQFHRVKQPSGTWITQKKTTHDLSYAYTGPQPHAPAHIGDRTFSYDRNGNQTGWEHDNNGNRRTIVWDEENRIQEIANNGHTMHYTYDHDGNRVIKRGPQGETVYVNQYFTIRNRENGTKHVYVGDLRISSKLMKQDKPGSNPNGSIPEEKDVYFYHPDHLGSSAYVTDVSGDLYQHLEYFPFGESFVEEVSNTQRTPYWFTAKELDEEIDAYYFGARYYDPMTAVWMSADPILDSYLDGHRGLGGVFNPVNLSLYHYAGLNPIKFVDPDGNALDWYDVGDFFVGAVDSLTFGLTEKIRQEIGTDKHINTNSTAYKAGGITADVATLPKTLVKKGGQKLVQKLSKGCSFVPGTLVMTEYGLMPIEQIVPGINVLARDEITGDEAWHTVVGSLTKEHTSFLVITVVSEAGEAEDIITTDEHPFYVHGKGWTTAAEIAVNDFLRQSGGHWLTVADYQRIELVSLAYDLDIDGYDTYFVGESQAWVHNCKIKPSSSSPALKGDPYHPDVVKSRIKPEYKPNLAHDKKSSLFNPYKTPEPADAAGVYENSVRGGNMNTWYGKGSGGDIYRYFSDNAGTVHFSGIVPKSQVPNDVLKQIGK